MFVVEESVVVPHNNNVGGVNGNFSPIMKRPQLHFQQFWKLVFGDNIKVRFLCAS